MGVVQYPAQVKLFCGLLVAPAVSQSDVEDVLQQHFGTIILRSQAFPFLQTSYYTREMGEGLTRLFLAFAPLISIPELVAVKHATNRLEGRWSAGPDQRRVNLDPGYLDLGKVVLATTKNHAHRLYISAGIYAEVTLRYRQKTFQAWEWTYPDYQLPSAVSFFNQLRDLYKAQLRMCHPPRSESL
jgi:Domain of unknown function (DUF4416)